MVYEQRCNYENTDLTYYQRNQEGILNKAKDYKNRKLSEEEKDEKREYGKNRCHNMYEKKTTKTKRISKKIIMIKKSLSISSVFCCYFRHTTNIIITKILFFNCNFNSYTNKLVF